MKQIYTIVLFLVFAGIYQSAFAQNNAETCTADSVQMDTDVGLAEELFLFKNNTDLISSGMTTKLNQNTKPFETVHYSFKSEPECCPLSVACKRIEKSVMLARIK